jgi:hypothetical protein
MLQHVQRSARQHGGAYRPMLALPFAGSDSDDDVPLLARKKA